MARKKDRYRAYVYEETAHSGKGILAAVLGGVSLLIFLLLAGICAALAGGAGEWSGSVGFTAFAAAFYGLVTGLESFHQPSKSYFFSKLGTLLCALVNGWLIGRCSALLEKRFVFADALNLAKRLA